VTRHVTQTGARSSRKAPWNKQLLTALVLGTLAFSAFALAGCAGASSPAPTTPETPAVTQETTPAATTVPPAEAPAAPTAPAKSKPFAPVKKLVIKDSVVGKGAAAKSGDSVTVNYTGWLPDGTQFDSSVGKQPFVFALGTGYVIPGWDKGVVGMKVGGKRVLYIPGDLAYGPQGSPPIIPPNATLKFEIEMLGINAQ
jgi:FKBP-type peptidyl-prolyl cis-trans isomerase